MSQEGLDESTSERSATPDELKIGYVGGGSREWALKLINDLAQTEALGGEVVLYDVDYEGATRNKRFGNWMQDRERAVGDWTYRAVKDRTEALDGADVVILSTQFPASETHKHDLEIPKEYGLYEPVAITIGPAGILRAMRTIPVYRDLARAIREHCPDAWVLNYTNPMTFVTRTLYREFPDINALGLCHEVFHVQELFADLVAEYYDVERPSGLAIDVNVKGINHFTWVDEARWDGRDLFPLLDEYLDREGVVREYTPEEMEDVSSFADNNQVAFELYERFGVLPAAGDRHLVEYAPWFLQDEMPEDLLRWGVKRTTSEYRVDRWENELSREELDRYVHSETPLPDDEEAAEDILHALESLKRIKPWKNDPERIEEYATGDRSVEFIESGEVIVDIVRALTGLESFETHVNLPNEGQMAGVPEDAVVETNALVSQGDVTPLVAGDLPRPVHTQVMTHVHNQETIIEAAFEGYDVDLAFQGFLNDPQVGTLQINTAQNLFVELVAAEREYLDAWELENSTVLTESDAITL